MKIIKVQPRDVAITFEIGLVDAENLVEVLDICEVKPVTDKQKAGFSFLKNVFFPLFNNLVEDVKDGP